MDVLTETDTKTLLTLGVGPACHELRSPLAVVYGFAKMLQGQDGLDETTQRYVTAIVDSSQRLDDLLDTLSKLGRIAAGRLHPTPESVGLRTLVHDLCATNSNTGRMQVEPGDDVNVKVDPSWFSEALQCLVAALCFEEDMRVRCTWTHDAHDVHINVYPSGGMGLIDVSPEKASLSLALSRMRIAAMGGTIEGTDDRVIVTVPRG